jgi:vacuolar iron transporter family protein
VVTRDGISHHVHEEGHLSDRAAMLRAGVLGANDGLLSTASLVVGVAAAASSRSAVLTAGVAGLVAGALSMAVGEWASVSSQRDAELADLDKERAEINRVPDAERHELAGIYRRRGLSTALADAVALELSNGDALRHHARDELGLDMDNLSKPAEAAGISAVSFSLGALVPIVFVALASARWRVSVGVVSAGVGLALLGALGARVGGADWRKPTSRVVLGGVIALAVSFAIGRAIGSVV